VVLIYSCGYKLQYEREMLELRRAMEALQSKLNRAEERLFGRETPVKKEPELMASCTSPEKDRFSKNLEENSKEIDQLLQRLLSAEEEMKREQDLLTALDEKQKLIEVQEEKVS